MVMWMIFSCRFAALALLLGGLCSQALANTVFSFHGLGNATRRIDARSRSMGGAGRALIDGHNFSTHNPALLGAFVRSSASAEFLAQRRSVDGGVTFNDGDLGRFQVVFPIARSGPVLGIGYESLTDMDFGAVDTVGTGDTGYVVELDATGGVQALSVGIGQRMGRRLFLGGRIDLVMFGTLNETWVKRFNRPDIYFYTQDHITRTHRGWMPSLGVVYTPTSSLSLGSNVQIGREIRQRQVLTTRYVQNDAAVDITTENQVKLPSMVGFGAVYLGGYRWLAALDVERGFWRDTGAGRFNTWDVSFGGLYRTGNPDPLVRSRRWELTAGLHHRSLYFPTATGNQIGEWGASFGVAIPFKNHSGRFRYVIEVGRRGDRDLHGVSEQFIQQSFAVTGIFQ